MNEYRETDKTVKQADFGILNFQSPHIDLFLDILDLVYEVCLITLIECF